MAEHKDIGDFPTLPFGLQLLGNIFDQVDKPKFNMLNPSKFEDELTLSNADVSSEISMLKKKAGSTITKASSDIKQNVAASRLPQSVATSGVSRVARSANEAADSALPGLKREQRDSRANFINMQNKFLQDKLGFEMGQRDRGLAGLGNLAQTALLWQAGFLNN